jgi:D-threo-aldose 1-dehydrogenase
LPAIDAPLLRRSLEASLRRLRTDHIDLLLLHEPVLQRIPDPDGLTAALNDFRQRGVIGGWGVAGRYEGLAPIIASFPALAQVVQTAENEWPDDAERRPDITYSAMSAGPQQFHNRRQPGDVALQRLEIALRRRPSGAILVSSSQPSHLKAVADLEAALPQ